MCLVLTLSLLSSLVVLYRGADRPVDGPAAYIPPWKRPGFVPADQRPRQNEDTEDASPPAAGPLLYEDTEDASPPAAGRFVQVASLESEAASGVACFEDADGSPFIAMANYYGVSSMWAFDTVTEATRLVQQFLSRQAHDWEAVRLPGGMTQLILAEYGAGRPSTVFLLNDSAVRSSLASLLPEQPLAVCSDAPDSAASCEGWRGAGECTKNPGYMHGACAKTCGLCARTSGPLVPVQLLPTVGASAARAFAIGARHFLAVSTSPHVAVFEWSWGGWETWEGSRDAGGPARAFTPPWRELRPIAIEGIAELAHGVVAGAAASRAEHLLALATWYAHGSHESRSHILRVRVDDPQRGGEEPSFTELQTLPTRGAHDVEFIRTTGTPAAGYAAGEVPKLVDLALLANSRGLPSVLYRYDGQRYVSVQEVPTTGAHDWEPISLPGGGFVLAVANQGDGHDCTTGSVGVFALLRTRAAPVSDASPPATLSRWSDELQLVEVQSLPVGCTVFSRSFVAASSVYLVVAVERTGADDADASSYRTQSLVYRYQPGDERVE